MKKEDLIIKWLDNGLDEKELKAFEKLDASSTFMKIDAGMKAFKAPALKKEATYSKIQAATASSQQSFPWRRMIGGIAALLVIALGVYFSYFQTDTTTFFAQNQEHQEFILPDESKVILNADSEISYVDEEWPTQRKLFLKGEAFFDVEKGSRFTVTTEQGTVTVLGTEFNVKARPDYFEVLCYEGMVGVEFNGRNLKLPAGSGYRIYRNEEMRPEVTPLEKPTWIAGESSFQSVSFAEIVKELERQYNIEVSYDSSLAKVKLTTSFTQKNLDAALQAITIPLKLSYDLDGINVTLKPSQQ